MNYKNEQGVTLAELLIVVSVIGILAGVVVGIVNPATARSRAQDGVRLNTVKNLAEGIESYRQIEGEYPTYGDTQDEGSLLRTVYLDSWPADPDEEYKYDSDGTTGFILLINNSKGTCYKYQTSWTGMMECSLSPTNECDAATPSLATDCSPL
jgi:prepilin-type N-terminal cleavage/methylation domain-containing protein